MPKSTNGNGNGHQPATDKSTLETALEKIETIKGSCRESIRGLNELTDMLKQSSASRRTRTKSCNRFAQRLHASKA